LFSGGIQSPTELTNELPRAKPFVARSSVQHFYGELPSADSLFKVEQVNFENSGNNDNNQSEYKQRDKK